MKVGLISGYSAEKFFDNYSEFGLDEESSNVFFEGDIGENTVYLIPRHGKNHTIPPHKVPEKDYFNFFKKEGVKDLVTYHSVGIIRKDWKVPCLTIIDDFMDFSGNGKTMYEHFDEEPIHVSMDEPYDKKYVEDMNKIITENSKTPLYRGIYAQTRGPRLETKAEIRYLDNTGADMVGMTHASEATLANECGMKLVSLGAGVNYACGVSENKVNIKDIIRESKKMTEESSGLVKKFISSL